MLSFLAKRLLATLPVLLVVAVAVFMIVRLTPGDPAAVIGGNSATSEDLDRIRAQLGLTQPLWQQFRLWGGAVLQGDLGHSFFMNKPVVELIAQRMEPTLSLAAGTLLLAIVLALPLGTLAAWRMGSWLDKAVMAFSVAGFSVPVFVVGYVLIYVMALQLHWFPVQGYRRLEAGVWPWLHQLILPCLTLSVTYVALLARVTRAAVSEALTEDYIRTARAKGLSQRQSVLRHALRNALIPVLTIIGLQFSFLLAGAIIIENVFFLPGLGRLIFQAITQRDLIVVESVVMLLVFAVILVTFLVDLAYAAADPRLRRRGA